MVENLIVISCIIIVIVAAVYASLYLEGPDRGKKTDDERMTGTASTDATEKKPVQTLHNQKNHKKRNR